MEGSPRFKYSSTKTSSLSSTSVLQSLISTSSVSLITRSAAVTLRCRGTSHMAGGKFQYGKMAIERYSASRSAVYTASITGSSCVSESKL